MPAAGFLINLQMAQANQAGLDIINHNNLTLRITFFKAHARDRSYHFKTERRNTHANHSVFFKEKFGGKLWQVKAIIMQDGNHFICVLPIYGNPDVHVCGGAWIAIKADGVTTNQQIFNLS